MKVLQKLESWQGWLLFVLREKWFQAVKSALKEARGLEPSRVLISPLVTTAPSRVRTEAEPDKHVSFSGLAESVPLAPGR